MAHPTRKIHDWWLGLAGGPARARVILLLGSVLGLDTADVGSVGAIAGKLEHALSLNNTQLGLLAAAPAISSAVFTVPMGVLADRFERTRVLWITMLAWSGAEVLSGLSGSYEMLIVTRICLGLATAAATPMVASLVGDLFPGAERGRIWGLILSGELIGAAFGYLVAGEAATFGSGSWRYAFYVLAAPSLMGALAVRRWLPEPLRGGRSWLRPGARKLGASGAAQPARAPNDGAQESQAQEAVAEQRVAPVQERVLHNDPERMGLWRATRYVLAVPTNVVLIIASALGYFYFTGVTTFGLVYFEQRYHVAHGTATLLLVLLGAGGLVGVISGGRIADNLLQRGTVNGRIIVGAISFTLTALLFLPGLLTASVVVSVPLFVAAAVAFGARNPPLDAARLDIMHHRLWGRAEAVRTLLRRTMTATAPIVFGVIADQLGPSRGGAARSGGHGFGASANAHGLQLAFLVLLVTLAVGGVLTFVAARTYPQDVATAMASEEETRPGDRPAGQSA